MNNKPTEECILSVLIPAHNEAEGIVFAVSTIAEILNSCVDSWEIIIIDDGSTDTTFSEVCAISSNDRRIKAIRFSRNFGKEAAILAGLRKSAGQAVVTIDADLQHPPRHIPEMIQHWRAGAQVVDAVKRSRGDDSFLVRLRARFFNNLLTRLSGIDVQNSSDFKLLDRVVVDAIVNELPEKRRFFRGLVDWVGYRHVRLPFDTDPRASGEGKWSLWELVGLAMTAIVSFTSTPLRIVTVLGLFTLVFGAGVSLEALWSWFHGEAVSGFATLIITLLLLGSFIMISLGVMGEYIAKIYDEIKARPVFLVAETIGFDGKKSKSVDAEKYCDVLEDSI